MAKFLELDPFMGSMESMVIITVHTVVVLIYLVRQLRAQVN